jgi:hypothetical protein
LWDELALDRIRQVGEAPVSTAQIMPLMVSSWAEGAVLQMFPILDELYAASEGQPGF